MASMITADRDAFLATTRIGIFTTLRDDGSPVAVPVWFEWDGTAVRIFSGATSGKVRRLERDRRATLLVANSVGEPEAWVAFDGRASVHRGGAVELAERLAHRYWDMTDPAKKAELEGWRRAAATLVVIELRPDVIRTSNG